MFSDKKKKDEDEDFIAEEGVISEDVEIEEEEGNLAQRVKDLKSKLKTTEMEKAINLDGWQRERADFLNFKRRTNDEKTKEREYATAKYIEKLLPFADSFELAQKSIIENSSIDDNTKNGLKGIATQLGELMSEYGVTKLSPSIGAPFDPIEHEALSTIDVENESQSNTIQGVIQSGYSIGNTIVRPARVIVGQFDSKN